MGIDKCTIRTTFGDNPLSRSKVMKEIKENTKIKMAAKIDGNNQKTILYLKMISIPYSIKLL